MTAGGQKTCFFWPIDLFPNFLFPIRASLGMRSILAAPAHAGSTGKEINMSVSTEDCGLVALVIDLLDGNTTPARAACGLPAPFLNMFGLAEKLGRLDRGEIIELDSGECGLLDEILDWAYEQERLGKRPRRSEEVIAAIIKRVAIDNVPLEEWVFKLSLGMFSEKGWSFRRRA